MKRLLIWMAKRLASLLEDTYTSGTESCEYLGRLRLAYVAQDRRSRRITASGDGRKAKAA